MWDVLLYPDFEKELDEFPSAVRVELLARLKFLKEFGPLLGRPQVDTLKGSSFVNMKEIRFEAEDGVWRTAFAFDPQRRAILLVAGDKSGVSESRFYQKLIDKADQRFTNHLARMKEEAEHDVQNPGAKDRRIKSPGAGSHRSPRRRPYR